jgi:oligopeptide/dipeptide ABC transporter ATP-binding protein
MSLLELWSVVKDFPRGGLFTRRTGAVRAVDGVSLHLDAGKTLALVGESGSGKTTVGKLALRLLEPTAGEVLFEGTPIHRLPEARMRPLRSRMSMIFQDPYASLNPRQRVGYIVGRPLDLHDRLTPLSRRTRVLELLDRVGLQPPDRIARQFPHQLSGGQRQRVAIARSIATHPSLVVADEPVSLLDVSVRAQILNLLMDLQADLKIAYLFISHDLAIVRAVSDDVAVMYRGQIVEQGRTEEVFHRPAHPYTQLLLASTPEMLHRGVNGSRQVRPGDGPSGGHGCRFLERCPFAMPACAGGPVPLLRVGGDHLARCLILQEHHPPLKWTAARSWLMPAAAEQDRANHSVGVALGKEPANGGRGQDP